MGLQNVCDSLLEETDGLLACIVLDQDTGLAIASSCREVNAASAVTRLAGSLFSGTSLHFVHVSPPANPLDNLVREAQVTTRNYHHFMAALPGWSSVLLVVVTEKAVSIALGWMVVHQAFHRVLETLPGTAATEMSDEPRTAPAASKARPTPRDPEPPPPVPPRPATPPGEAPQRISPSLRGNGPGNGRPDLGERTESAPAGGDAQTPTRGKADAQEERTERESPELRVRELSGTPPPGKDPMQPAVDEGAKAAIGRMGARTGFRLKPERS